MSQFTDFFKPETLFSRDNPFLKSAEKTHRLIFETLDKAARVQLSFAEDLLDINRERFESLYAGQSLTDMFTAQQNIVTELGKRTARYAGDLQEVVTSLQVDASEAANELAEKAVPKAKARSAKAKKAA
jgi:hypothetical protein